MTAPIDLLDLLLNPEKYEDTLNAIAEEYEAEKAARKAAEKAAEEKKIADYAAAGFFFNNLKRQYDCARCSGRGLLRQYKHVAGGVCFNCNGEGFRL